MSKPDSDGPLRSRREFIAQASVGAALLLTFTLDGCERTLSPAQARAAAIPLRALDAQEASVLESLGEALLPGSAQAGLAQYVDHQLAGDPADSLLMIQYLRVDPPYMGFYRAGLTAAREASLRDFGKPPAELDPQQRTALLTRMAAGEIRDWKGPPAPLFFFVLRSDAVDVTYGTPAGFDALGIPYMPHIMPPRQWG